MNDLEAQKRTIAELALIREFAGKALSGLMFNENDFEEE